MAFDLEQFARAPRTGPTPADRQLGRDMIDALRGLPDRSMIGKAAAALRMIPSNKEEREILVEILATCGIWRTPARSTYRSDGGEGFGVDDEAVAEFPTGSG